MKMHDDSTFLPRRKEMCNFETCDWTKYTANTLTQVGSIFWTGV